MVCSGKRTGGMKYITQPRSARWACLASDSDSRREACEGGTRLTGPRAWDGGLAVHDLLLLDHDDNDDGALTNFRSR